MNCPNCGYSFSDGNVCPNCLVDAVLYNKTLKISDTLFNTGLTKAKTQDLTGAIECLVKSIEVNKNNVTARNLLGLVYFELGRVGDALKQWVISSSLLREKNVARAYIESVQKDSKTTEKYSEAVRMYNQALVYIEQKSDDMAIIQLKKALEYNPKFVDALNLITFCYLIQREKEKALSCIEKVLAMDANNSIALNYYNEIYPSKSRPDPGNRVKRIAQPVTQIQPPSYTRLTSKDKKSFGNTFHVAEILAFLLGGICGFALVYILLMPSTVSSKDKIIEDLQKDKTLLESELTRTTDEKQVLSDTFDTERITWETEKEDLNGRIIRLDKIQKVTNAMNYYNQNMIEEAAQLFYVLDLSGLDPEMVAQAQEMKADCFEKTASAAYTQAEADYRARNYEEAKIKLDTAQQYCDPQADYYDDILYYLGLVAEENSDVASAIRHYERIENEYPNSNILTKAQNRLRALAGE